MKYLKHTLDLLAKVPHSFSKPDLPGPSFCPWPTPSTRLTRCFMVLSGLTFFTAFPTFAAYVPLIGISQLWKGSQSTHSCALTSSGGVLCWGNNGNGQLGDNSITTRRTPVAVSGLTSGVTALATETFYTCAVTNSGNVVQCWGANAVGQLGNNSTTESHIPVAVSSLTPGVTAIAAGDTHTCALISNGGVQCWGNNGNGQLGDNTIVSSLTPVAVSGLTSGMTTIAAGKNHTCVVTSSGVQCWGYNLYGQLGNNSTTESHTPVAVSGLTSGVKALAAGDNHTCAVTSGGGVQCWGVNGHGQLGDGTYGSHSTPFALTGLSSGVTAVTAGTMHTCALSGGGVWCWGENANGQLGDNTTTTRLTPVQVLNSTASAPLSGVTAITAGFYYTCAVISSGGVQCWGQNSYGELGNNTITNSSIPVDVLVNDTPPTATTVTISLNPSGTPTWTVNETLKGNYIYSDVENDVESGTTFQWYQATDSSCSTGKTAMVGATALTYTLVSSDVGKYICFGVTPQNTNLNGRGTEVLATSSSTINPAPLPAPIIPVPATVISPPVPLPTYHLQLLVTGAGGGQLVSNFPVGLDCTTATQPCSYTITGATWVDFTVTPDPGSELTGWSGDSNCGNGGHQILVTQDTTCTVTFGLKNYQLTANFLGRGQVTGSGINCPGQCTATYPYGTTVTLKAQISRRWMWEFSDWQGCDSQGNIQINYDVLCQAIFTPDPNIPNVGDGNGDGLPDAYQDNVVSLPDKVTGTYLTLEAQPDTCIISDIYPDLPEAQTVKLDPTKKFHQGLLYFDLACPQAQVSVYYHGISKLSRNLKFYKFGPKVPGDLTTLAWYQLPSVKYEVVTIGGKPVVKGTYALTDGELGDNTGVDGHIVDPGGLVYP